MTGLMQDAEMIAKSARRAHSRSSLFAVSALGALAAGVVLTVRDGSIPSRQVLWSLTPHVRFAGRSWFACGRNRSHADGDCRWWHAHWPHLRSAIGRL
jgi:hypothetical protein